MTNSRTSLTLPNGVSLNYGYDAASQLTGITYMLGTNTLGNLTYAYDLAGQCTGVGGSYARTGTPQAAPLASYTANNQLTNWKRATLTYGANGNLTSEGTNTYTWNARNQLQSIGGGVSASFQYDPFGRRVSKTIGGTTQYLYDGPNPVQEISGSSASANLLTGGVDEYFQRTDSAGTRNLLTDVLHHFGFDGFKRNCPKPIHVRAVRQHFNYRYIHDQQFCIHRSRTRCHRSLLLPRQILQPPAPTVRLRRSGRSFGWLQSLFLRSLFSHQLSRPFRSKVGELLEQSHHGLPIQSCRSDKWDLWRWCILLCWRRAASRSSLPGHLLFPEL